jgi:hypothetical protein
MMNTPSDNAASVRLASEGRASSVIIPMPARADVAPYPADLLGESGPLSIRREPRRSGKLPLLLPYFGIFLDHDLTVGSVTWAGRPPAAGARTPALDLHSVYGHGPLVSPHLYDAQPQRANKLRVGASLDGVEDLDLPRDDAGKPLAGDPRNDGLLVLAQWHVAMLRFHNAVVDQLPALNDGVSDDGSAFAKARRIACWHYQWLVLHHFLPALVGAATVADVLRERSLFIPKRKAALPAEFALAATQFKASMIPPACALNDQCIGTIDGDALRSRAAEVGAIRSLRGGPIRASDCVNWKNFLDTGVPVSPGATSRMSCKIGTALSPGLLGLTHARRHRSMSDAGAPCDLLQAALDVGLPSGQDAATFARARVLSLRALQDVELWRGTPFACCPAPLWHYVLREAEVQHDGEQLGDLGGRIFAEVLIGLLQLDPHSFLARRPSWRPIVAGRAAQNDFSFVDLLRIASMQLT